MTVAGLESQEDSKRHLLRSLASPHHWGLILALAITVVSGVKSIHHPVFGDGEAYMIPDAELMADRPFYPFIDDEVHPPFFFFLEGVVFRIAGAKVESAHALILVAALFSVVTIYLLGSSLAGPAAGSAAALLLASWAPFFIQARLIRLSIPLTAFSLATLLSVQKGWVGAYIVLGSLAALTKAPGVLVTGAIAGLATLGLYRSRIPRLFLWIPVAVYAAWLVACKIHYGWFLFPENVEGFKFSWIMIGERWLFWLKRLVVDQRAWLPVAVALLVSSRRKVHLVAPLPLAILASLLIPGFSLPSGVALGLFLSVGLVSWSLGGIWRVLPTVALLFTALFTPYHYKFPRYLLPAWPGIALFCSISLSGSRKALFVVFISSGLMLASAFERTGWYGHGEWSLHESNMAYEDWVSCRKNAVAYLEKNAEGLVIAAEKPAIDLTHPSHGYVSRALSVLTIRDLLRSDCGILREADYYYRLSIASDQPDIRFRAHASRCGVRLIPVWETAGRKEQKHGSKPWAVIYRIERAGKQPEERNQVSSRGASETPH